MQESMFSDSFLTAQDHYQGNNTAPDTVRRPKSPPRSCEEWIVLENIEQWPCPAPGENGVPQNDPDSIVGSLEDIREDLRKHSRK